VYVCMCAYVSMVAEMDRAVRPSSTSCVYVCECVCVFEVCVYMCVCGYMENDGRDGHSSQALKYLQCVCMCVYVCVFVVCVYMCVCVYVATWQMMAEMDRAVRPSSTYNVCVCVYVCICEYDGRDEQSSQALQYLQCVCVCGVCMCVCVVVCVYVCLCVCTYDGRDGQSSQASTHEPSTAAAAAPTCLFNAPHQTPLDSSPGCLSLGLPDSHEAPLMALHHQKQQQQHHHQQQQQHHHHHHHQQQQQQHHQHCQLRCQRCCATQSGVGPCYYSAWGRQR